MLIMSTVLLARDPLRRFKSSLLLGFIVFYAGAGIVILACNTASAWTLRKLQTEVFPDKKILGVTIPGAEKSLNEDSKM